MATKLRIGISPCPNDTFAFHALMEGRVELPFEAEFVVRDVEELNRLALAGELDVTKVSFHLAALVMDRYMILNSGAALGRGCGPLLLARSRPEDVRDWLSQASIAIPGRHTTAALLLGLFLAEETPVGHDEAHGDQNRRGGLVEMLFSRIPEAVAKGEVDAGLVIHEIRFTYRQMGLECLADLGDWWEDRTGLAIPLGGIIGRRELGRQVLHEMEDALRRSILAAKAEPEAALRFAARYAQDMTAEVMAQHIGLYVNDFTVDLGDEGKRAIISMFEKAARSGALAEAGGMDGMVDAARLFV